MVKKTLDLGGTSYEFWNRFFQIFFHICPIHLVIIRRKDSVGEMLFPFC
tara:strand:+ start:1123 stop:1269 length:147 start_codon:yes stop_codon:yes gene_type:complete